MAKKHRCDAGDFDRAVCPEPCGWMHSFCTRCGARQEHCRLEGPLLDRDAAIGHALLLDAIGPLPFLDALEEAGWTVTERYPRPSSSDL